MCNRLQQSFIQFLIKFSHQYIISILSHQVILGELGDSTMLFETSIRHSRDIISECALSVAIPQLSTINFIGYIIRYIWQFDYTLLSVLLSMFYSLIKHCLGTIVYILQKTHTHTVWSLRCCCQKLWFIEPWHAGVRAFQPTLRFGWVYSLNIVHTSVLTTFGWVTHLLLKHTVERPNSIPLNSGLVHMQLNVIWGEESDYVWLCKSIMWRRIHGYVWSTLVYALVIWLILIVDRRNIFLHVEGIFSFIPPFRGQV